MKQEWGGVYLTNQEITMLNRFLLSLLCLSVLGATTWLSTKDNSDPKSESRWTEVAPGVWRSPGTPAGHALVDGEHALLIDAPSPADELKMAGVKTIDRILLTHHHRDTLAALPGYLAAKVPVQAPKASAPWVTAEGVSKYWKESLPLRNSRTAYLVLTEGLLADTDCSLIDGQSIDWRGWTLTVAETPGHTRDHVAFIARKGKEGPLLLFCGDALAAPGKLWSPYTTDWDHWTDLGLKPTAQSLRKLAALQPAVILPAHGDVIRTEAGRALERTAGAVEEMAFLKSFERYTKERLKNPPTYAFLAKEQSQSNGSKPWSRISEHLFLTGNTYVLVSREKACLVVDPWDPHSARQIPKLQMEQKLGPVEVVLCSHAHFDHYDGAYSLMEREKCQFWTLEQVAVPLADPALLRAPFLDVRPLKIDRRLRDGQTAAWREYQMRFHFLPGQTEFTMGVETTIDGKRCFFTADNFFHHDQFSGTGGWMGLNRSFPLLYASSAQKVLDAAPDWVLAEHGSAMEFNAEDFRRRVQWGKVSAQAADALCPSGNHLQDWNPHRVHVEPVLHQARPGDVLQATLVAGNPLPNKQRLRVLLDGGKQTADQTWEIEIDAKGEARRPVRIPLARDLAAGRHILALRVMEGEKEDSSDAFVAVDVAP